MNKDDKMTKQRGKAMKHPENLLKTTV